MTVFLWFFFSKIHISDTHFKKITVLTLDLGPYIGRGSVFLIFRRFQPLCSNFVSNFFKLCFNIFGWLANLNVYSFQLCGENQYYILFIEFSTHLCVCHKKVEFSKHQHHNQGEIQPQRKHQESNNKRIRRQSTEPMRISTDTLRTKYKKDWRGRHREKKTTEKKRTPTEESYVCPTSQHPNIHQPV